MNIKKTFAKIWCNYQIKAFFLVIFSVVFSTFFLSQNNNKLISHTSLLSLYNLPSNSANQQINNLHLHSDTLSGFSQNTPNPDKKQFWLLELRETFLSETWNYDSQNINYDIQANTLFKKWEENIVVVKNEKSLIPIIDITKHVHIFDFTHLDTKPFRKSIQNYTGNITFQKFDAKFQGTLRSKEEDQISIILFDANTFQSVPENITGFLQKNEQTIFIRFGNISQSGFASQAQSVVYVKSHTNEQLAMMGQMLYGGIRGTGKIPSCLIDTALFATGLETAKTRLGYKLPKEFKKTRQMHTIIDSIMQDAIHKEAFPGGQIFVAHKGMVIYNESFGHHDYTQQRKTQNTDLYDIASITKIAATTLATMKMVDEKKINLDSPLSHYFKDTIPTGYKQAEIGNDSIFSSKADTRGEETVKPIRITQSARSDSLNTKNLSTQTLSEKSIFNVPLRKLLVHQSGINPSLPILPYYQYEKTYSEIMLNERQDFYADQKENYLAQNTGADIPEGTSRYKFMDVDSAAVFFPFDKKMAFQYFFSEKKVDGVAVARVAENMFLKEQFRDSLFNEIKKMKVHNDTVYQYSCTNMILMQMVVDSIIDGKFETYLKEEFYHPLGMHQTTYNPLNHFEKDKITPTEHDEKWRGQLLQGTVHDPSAALLGGVSGNAGLFSTAADLGILGQMLLNKGDYGGKQYLDTATVRQFTQKQEENNRGLGFD
ncbi:MAG: serine hydrolase domain-containing protein, partial [Bacteroidota bacterium]